MLREVLVSGVDVRLISVGVCYARFEVVRDQDLADTPEKLERMDMRCDPGRQVLSQGGLRKGVTAGAKGGDENLDFHTLAGGRVYDGDSLAGVIDEELFSSTVFLPEGDIEFFHLLAIEVAELAVLIPVRVGLSVFVPQKLEGDCLPLQLSEKIIHGGHGALGGGEKNFFREKHVFEGCMIEGGVKRPG
jgi:hypothetical protein